MKSINDFFHVTPAMLPSASEYTTHITDLRDSLLSSNPQWPNGLELAANPYPFYAPPKRVAELQQIQTALHTAVLAIIRNWWSTPRYQAAIPTSFKVERVLRALDSRRPYTDVGSYRPDFLIPLHRNAPLSICEINARFLYNGYMATSYTCDYFDRNDSKEKYKDFKRSAVEDVSNYCHEYAGVSRSQAEPYCSIASFSQLFDQTKTLALVKGREFGLDIHLFKHCYNKSRFVDPKDLTLVSCSKSPSGYTLADDLGTIEQIALELHQDELDALDEEVLLELGARCHNDLRTIFLMHDKRMLGLIHQELDNLVASSALTAAQAAVLRSRIIETHIPGTKSFRTIMNQPQNKNMWLLKPFLAGKGEGIIFGKDVDEATWKNVLRSKPEGKLSEYYSLTSTIPYVIQRYIHQKRHDLFVRPENSGEPPRRVNWFIVGTILCLNNTFLGAGIWRTSSSDITAVSRGGEFLSGVTNSAVSLADLTTPHINLPVHNTLTSLQVPAAARTEVSLCNSLPKHLNAIREALRTYGIAAVHLNFPDPNSTYMLDLARTLGPLIDHSKTNGPLWDVKPKSGVDLARSQTTNNFPWHTDCSFDSAPARYFALHVIHSDRCGGGKLKVLAVDNILNVLRPSTLETLKRPVFRIRVPKEFDKDIAHITGALLTSDGKIRYRKEIIEPLGDEAVRAIEELDSVLLSSERHGWAKVLDSDIMRDGTIVCLDNAKWLHARSEVRDPQRWLRRIRWGPEDF